MYAADVTSLLFLERPREGVKQNQERGTVDMTHQHLRQTGWSIWHLTCRGYGLGDAEACLTERLVGTSTLLPYSLRLGAFSTDDRKENLREESFETC